MTERARLTAAWQGRIAGCQLGKPVELLSMRRGLDALHAYLDGVDARPLRDYVPYDGGETVFRASCKDEITRSEPDDDINYTVLRGELPDGEATTAIDFGRSLVGRDDAVAVLHAEYRQVGELVDRTIAVAERIAP